MTVNRKNKPNCNHRTITFSVRLSKQEHDLIKRGAQAAQEAPSTFVRERALLCAGLELEREKGVIA